eukprot:9603198-Alexandrium_andersonii.AAC.1
MRWPFATARRRTRAPRASLATWRRMPAPQAPAIARSGPSTALACSVAACAPGPARGHHGLADVRAQR